jgi:leader peptidase (prepilin peptidase)/N-methyltransferase
MAKRRGEDIDEVALGFGDVSLSAVLGLLLGWPRIAVNLVFAIIIGGIFSAIFLVIQVLRKRYKAFTPIPYAPFLLISAIGLLYLATSH